MKRLFFTTIMLLLALTTVQAQWYLETGINDAKFAQYVNISGNKTTLHSYDGLRDFSHTIGYVFPFKSLEKRLQDDAKPSSFRLGIGIGFDQMNLNTKAQITGNSIPVHYNMGQWQGQLNLLFTPTIISKEYPGDLNIRRPAVNLLFEGGLTYSMYTSAVRTYTTSRNSYIDDLKKDKKFVDAYPSYTLGAGLEFPLSRYSAIYGKYVVENAFSNEEKEAGVSNERFSTVKRRVMVGIRLDMRLENKLKTAQRLRIEALEAREKQPQAPPVDLSDLYAKIEALQKALDEHKHDLDKKDPVINERLFDVKKHEKGFMYLPDFKHVLFPRNSSYFDESKYASKFTSLATFMKQNSHLKIQLVGYADSKTGTKSANLKLSERRAKRVYDDLLKHGIPADKMSYMGAGETLQFSIKQVANNRRTEIIILQQ